MSLILTDLRLQMSASVNEAHVLVALLSSRLGITLPLLSKAGPRITALSINVRSKDLVHRDQVCVGLTVLRASTGPPHRCRLRFLSQAGCSHNQVFHYGLHMTSTVACCPDTAPQHTAQLAASIFSTSKTITIPEEIITDVNIELFQNNRSHQITNITALIISKIIDPHQITSITALIISKTIDPHQITSIYGFN